MLNTVFVPTSSRLRRNPRYTAVTGVTPYAPQYTVAPMATSFATVSPYTVTPMATSFAVASPYTTVSPYTVAPMATSFASVSPYVVTPQTTSFVSTFSPLVTTTVAPPLTTTFNVVGNAGLAATACASCATGQTQPVATSAVVNTNAVNVTNGCADCTNFASSVVQNYSAMTSNLFVTV